MSPTLPIPTTPYYGGGQVVNPANVLQGKGAPNNNAASKPGILYADVTNNNAYMSTNPSIWVQLGGVSGPVDSLTGDSGGAIMPSAGNITLAGTANQITTTGSGSTITWTIPSTFIAPGTIASTTTLTGGTGITATTGNIVASAGNISTTVGSISSAATVTAGTGMTATTGNITATAGNLVATAGNLALNGAASKISINAGTASSASVGTGTLTSGVFTVATSAATASSLVFATYITYAGTGGILKASAISGHITVTSADLTDSTSTIQYWIVN